MAWITVSRVYGLSEVDYARLLIGDVLIVVTDFTDLLEFDNIPDFNQAVADGVIGKGELCFLQGRVRKVLQTDIESL